MARAYQNKPFKYESQAQCHVYHVTCAAFSDDHYLPGPVTLGAYIDVVEEKWAHKFSQSPKSIIYHI